MLVHPGLKCVDPDWPDNFKLENCKKQTFFLNSRSCGVMSWVVEEMNTTSRKASMQWCKQFYSAPDQLMFKADGVMHLRLAETCGSGNMSARNAVFILYAWLMSLPYKREPV